MSRTDNKARVLILGNYPPPYGGVPRHIEYLAPYLVAHGWYVHVLSGGNSGVEENDGVKVYKYSHLLKFILLFSVPVTVHLKTLILLFRKLDEKKYIRHYYFRTIIAAKIITKEKISLVSAYNLYSTGIVAAVLSEMFSIPVLFTNFGEIYSHAEYFRRNPKVLPYVISRVSRLLAMSRHCAESYSVLGLSPSVGVIPYGVILSRFEQNRRGVIRSQMGLSEQETIVLFVGRLVTDMGVDTLLESALKIIRRTESVVFMIVGQKGDLLDSVQSVAAKSHNKITVFHSVPFEALPDYYYAADIVVAPTRGDRACGSLASIEGMAAGKPVVASEIGGIPEIVVDGRTGILVPPANSEELAHAILKLVNDKQLANSMGRAGRNRVEQLFNEEKTDEQIERICAELVRSKLD